MSKYTKFEHDLESATKRFGISIADDPGVDGLQPPPSMILCTHMYERQADWLLTVLEGVPYPFSEG